MEFVPAIIGYLCGWTGQQINDLKKLLKEKTLTDVDNDSDMADVDNDTVI